MHNDNPAVEACIIPQCFPGHEQQTLQELYIDTPEQLATFVDSIKSSPWLALDTEFIREKTYFPILCLLQVSDGRSAACIDPIAITDLGPLVEVLFDPSIIKVFHAARQDLEIFFNNWQRLPTPLFDTQAAAALLGYGEQIGYAGLIQKALNIELAKDHSRTDWARRPLEQGQLRYALDDVVYLGQAYEKMRQRLQQLGRLEWLDSEFSTLCDINTYTPEPMSMWQKVKGRQHLRGLRLATLQQLAAWREQQAVKRNLPRRWILKDEVMIDLAKRMPRSLSKMEGIRGLDKGVIRRDGETLLKLLEAASQIPKDQWPTEGRPAQGLSVEQEAMTDLLQAALRLIAHQHDMSAAAITGKKQLQALVRGERDLELLRGWRNQVAGKPLLQLLAGRLRFAVNQGVPELTAAE